MDKKELMIALNTLKRNCKEYPSCLGCYFDTFEDGCALRKAFLESVPGEWKDVPEEWKEE